MLCLIYFASLFPIQKGKDEYKLAPTTDGGEKKGKKGKGNKKNMDDLKKEVDLVSKQLKWNLSSYLNRRAKQYFQDDNA